MSSVGVESKHAAAAGTAKALQDSPAGKADDIVIGPGVRTAGKFQTAGSVFVDGALDEAEVDCRYLSISRGGEVRGVVQGERVEIAGSLDGEALAKEEIVLRATAVVTGKITAPYVVMHRGAYLSGTVDSMERHAESRKAAATMMPAFPRSRPRRQLNVFVCAAALGLLLAAGAAVAWWGGKDAKPAHPQAPVSST